MSNFVDSNIDQMVADSIRDNTIVVVTERIDTQSWVWLVNGLAKRAEDWTRITAGDNRLNEDVAEVREYWGDEDGDEWRIHVYSSR